MRTSNAADSRRAIGPAVGGGEAGCAQPMASRLNRAAWLQPGSSRTGEQERADHPGVAEQRARVPTSLACGSACVETDPRRFGDDHKEEAPSTAGLRCAMTVMTNRSDQRPEILYCLSAEDFPRAELLLRTGTRESHRGCGHARRCPTSKPYKCTQTNFASSNSVCKGRRVHTCR